MKAMMLKGMAGVYSLIDAALPPSRSLLRFLFQAHEPTASSAIHQCDAEPRAPNALEPSIYRSIFGRSLPQQLILLFTLISFPIIYISLGLSNTIINRAIGDEQFPQTMFGFHFDHRRLDLEIHPDAPMQLMKARKSFAYRIAEERSKT